MDTQTTLDNTKLSHYYFATRWAIAIMEDRIQLANTHGWSTQYDETQLEQLRDMEQFFKMSWDSYMENLTGHKMEEVPCG